MNMQMIVLNNSAVDTAVEDHKTFIDNMLIEHNRVRYMHSAGPLTLSKPLCTSAQNWADVLLDMSPLQNSPFTSKYRYGENVGLVVKKNTFPCINALRIVQSWYRDSFHYNFETGEGHRGNFTQMVWLSTKSGGFGRARNKDKCVIVAHYYPGGNIHGAYLSNVKQRRLFKNSCSSNITMETPEYGRTTVASGSPLLTGEQSSVGLLDFVKSGTDDIRNVSGNNFEVDEYRYCKRKPPSSLNIVNGRIMNGKSAIVIENSSTLHSSQSFFTDETNNINETAFKFMKCYLNNLKLDISEHDLLHVYRLLERHSRRNHTAEIDNLDEAKSLFVPTHDSPSEIPISSVGESLSRNYVTSHFQKDTKKREKFLHMAQLLIDYSDRRCQDLRTLDNSSSSKSEYLDESKFYLDKQRVNIKQPHSFYAQNIIKKHRFRSNSSAIRTVSNNRSESDSLIADKLLSSPKNIPFKRIKDHLFTAKDREKKQRIFRIRKVLKSADISNEKFSMNYYNQKLPSTIAKFSSLNVASYSREKYFQDEVLYHHNCFRSKHQTQPLEMDDHLNQLAGKWAQILSTRLLIESSDNSYLGQTLGENIVSRIYHNNCPPMAEELISDWYKQGRNYQYDKEPAAKGSYGNFTQIIWRNSRLLGVGKQEIKLPKGLMKLIVVCYYYPGGNLLNQFQENVLMPITQSSE